MGNVRCCPADCAVRSDWKEELQAEMEYFHTPGFREASTVLKILSHPSRLKIALMLLNRDHCVCEIIYELKERQNLTSYNLGMFEALRVDRLVLPVKAQVLQAERKFCRHDPADQAKSDGQRAERCRAIGKNVREQGVCHESFSMSSSGVETSFSQVKCFLL